MKSAVNTPEVKTNNSSEENDRAEVKCSSSEIRAAASVQWENNDKLHTTQKQTCAAWSTATETDRGGCTAEEEHADCERQERETSSDEEEECDENDEDQGPESREQDLTDEGISKHERQILKYSDEISKHVVEEMMFGAEQNEDRLIESGESETHDEAEQNETLEDELLSDPEQHTSENTPGSDLIVNEFPGELTDWGGFEEIQTKLHDPAERDSETKHDTEARIQTELSLKEHVEFRTELIVESTISSEDEDASPVSSQPHQLLEIAEGKSTLDAFSATSETTGSAEDQTDVKPLSTRSSSLAELLEEPVDLQADVAKTALEYVEEITNQVLKDILEAECNLVQKTEPLVEAPGDPEHQAPASVLEEERWMMDSSEEHISSAECESTDGRHEQKPIAGESLEDLMDVSRPGMKRGFDQMSEGLPEVKTGGQFELILQVM